MRKIQTKTEHRTSAKLIQLVTAALLVLFAAFLANKANYELSKIRSALTDPETIKFISGVVSSIAIGVLASFIYGRFQSREAMEVLDGIHEAGVDDLVDKIINQIASYSGTCFTSHRLSISLRPEPSNRFLIARLHYEYKKTLGAEKRVQFRILRSSSYEEEERIDTDPILLSDSYKRYEFFFKLNDQKIIDLGVEKSELDRLYKFEGLTIDGIPCDFDADSGSQNTFSATLPQTDDVNGERKFEYVVEFPMGWDTHMFILYEYPAKEIRINFDYSSISDQVIFDRIEMLGYELGFAGRQVQDGVTTISHHGWLLPKSGVTYVWRKIRS
ncbi:MAG: hypothetical protein AAF578_13940 [Pseudomonadota bacterium]